MPHFDWHHSVVAVRSRKLSNCCPGLMTFIPKSCWCTKCTAFLWCFFLGGGVFCYNVTPKINWCFTLLFSRFFWDVTVYISKNEPVCIPHSFEYDSSTKWYFIVSKNPSTQQSQSNWRLRTKVKKLGVSDSAVCDLSHVRFSFCQSA